MAQGLDYSYAHPDLNCIKSKGYSFVARYIGDPDPNDAKYLDAQELTRIRNAGLSVVVVRETTAGFMFTDSGATHAQKSRLHCNSLGLHGIPIYYALDVDPRGMSQSQREAVADFLHDAAVQDGGGHNVGIYGSDDALDWYRGADCYWGWQTYAWSNGRISRMAHFRQYLNGQSVCGGTVDLNETYSSDFGQWPRPSQPIPIPEKKHDMTTYLMWHPTNGAGYLVSDNGNVVLTPATFKSYEAAQFPVVRPDTAKQADDILATSAGMAHNLGDVERLTQGVLDQIEHGVNPKLNYNNSLLEIANTQRAPITDAFEEDVPVPVPDPGSDPGSEN